MLPPLRGASKAEEKHDEGQEGERPESSVDAVVDRPAERRP